MTEEQTPLAYLTDAALRTAVNAQPASFVPLLMADDPEAAFSWLVSELSSRGARTNDLTEALLKCGWGRDNDNLDRLCDEV